MILDFSLAASQQSEVNLVIISLFFLLTKQSFPAWFGQCLGFLRLETLYTSIIIMSINTELLEIIVTRLC